MFFHFSRFVGLLSLFFLTLGFRLGWGFTGLWLFDGAFATKWVLTQGVYDHLLVREKGGRKRDSSLELVSLVGPALRKQQASLLQRLLTNQTKSSNLPVHTNQPICCHCMRSTSRSVVGFLTPSANTSTTMIVTP